MQIEAHTDRTHLVVSINFANTVDETVYLKNWIFDWYGLLAIPEMHAIKSPKTAAPTHELAYACVGPVGELVLLSGDGPSFPVGISPTAPRKPFATRLAKGQTYLGTVRLPLPICEWYAYKLPATSPAIPIEVSKVRYRVEVLRESACKGPIEPLTNFKEVYRAHGHPFEAHEATAHLVRPITVLRRTDSFQRFA